MFANERRHKIIELLHAQQQVSVADMSDRFKVSDVTIRKDLRLLEKEGRLERTFGGAILPVLSEDYNHPSYIAPETLGDYEQKQMIGRLAADLVSDEDFIFLGPGLTCLEVAKHLKGKNRLSIMTMNISAAIELADVLEFKLISVPGDFTKRNGTYYVTGPLLFDYFKNTFFDKIFFTVDGFSIDRGFSVLDESTSKIFQGLLTQTKEVIVCTTASKFDKSAMAYLGPTDLANTIVTDSAPADAYQNYFAQRNIKLIYP